ncbi:MAG: class I SAM-dependent methyltransferase, partial [Lachnospiraceae bacterium]|nr:class I SAM-dependent methyltransferase [Lachnospiraceae bacterium]
MGTYNDDIEVENGTSYFEINFKYRKNLESVKREYRRYYKFFKYNYSKYLPQDKTAKIVDMACGIGETVNSLQKLGYTNVVGVDFDSENIKFCKGQGLNVKQGNIYDYFKDKKNEFDMIILNDIIEHIEKKNVISV